MNGFDAIVHMQKEDEYIVFQTGEQVQYPKGCWISMLSDTKEAVVVCHGTSIGMLKFADESVYDPEDIVREVVKHFGSVDRIHIVCCFPWRVRDTYEELKTSIPIEFIGNWNQKVYTQVQANGAYFVVTPENPKWVM